MSYNSTFLLILMVMCLPYAFYAQIGINSDNSAPDPSAMLDVKSTSQGFLTPRMTQAERNTIANPATGLLIYQMDDAPGFYYNQGTPATPDWVRIGNDENEVVCDSRIPIDSVAHFASYNGRFTSYLITEPGSYYLTGNILSAQTNAIGIYIDSDNVTLDLKGFTLAGTGADVGSADGIYIPGTKYNITIKNGLIDNWGSGESMASP